MVFYKLSGTASHALFFYDIILSIAQNPDSFSHVPIFLFPQLVLEAHNVPELSAGVNCTFQDLAEMNGLVEGNRIKCFSPAEKEMPRIIVDKGTVRVTLLQPHCPKLQNRISKIHYPVPHAGTVESTSD